MHIPIGVLKILHKYRWRNSLSTEELIEISGRKYGVTYFIYPGYPGSPNEAFTYEMTERLHRAGAFGRGSEIKSDGVIAVNEHAYHSLEDFLSAVTVEWEKHKERLSRYVDNAH